MSVAGRIALVVVNIGEPRDAVVLLPHIGDQALGRAQGQPDVLLGIIALEISYELAAVRQEEALGRRHIAALGKGERGR